jgi:basic amino acid/polyamine antiporter, APA family
VAEAQASAIERRLGAFDTAMIVVSLVIGIGIFRTPALVAGHAGTTVAFYLAWMLGGVISLCGALTYAEIGSRLPRAGGQYRAVAEAYHPMAAFMLTWSQAVLQGAGAAGVAFIGAEYLNLVLLPAGARTPGALLASAGVLMLVLLALNWAGIRTGARTQNVLSLSKIVMIAGLALSALLLVGQPAAPVAAAAAATMPPLATLAGFASAAVAVFYTYGGYQGAMNLAGDVREPQRNLPRAVTGGVLVIIALYFGINAAYERVLGLSGVAASPLVAAALARATLGPVGEVVVSVAIFLSAAGFVNATILQMPRSYYAMAEDGALPAAFLRVDPRTQVQRVGLAFFAFTMLGPALMLGSFDKLLNYVMFSDSLALAALASTLFVLRRRDPAGAGFRMPGYPVLPALFMACLLGVSLRVLVTETRISLIGLGVLLAGIPLFLIGRRASGRT